jgi:hypothetical protein
MAELKDDFTEAETPSGSLVPGVNGYLRAVFSETVYPEIKKSFGQIIANTKKEYEPIDARREANLKAYEAASGTGEAITIPVIKRDVNQQLAWILDAILSKEPPFTVRALDNDPVPVLAGSEDAPELIPIPADEYAEQLQALVNFYLLHKIGFRRTLRSWVHELLRDGNRPPILKVIYEDREREELGLSVVKDDDGKIVRIEKDPVYRTVRDGEPARIEGIPGDKFFVPFPSDDIQRAPFVWQEFEEDTATIKDKIARGVYDFCREKPDRDVVDRVISGCKTTEDLDRWRGDGRRVIDPIKTHKLYEMWFDYPFAELVPGQPAVPESIDPATGEATPGTPATEDEVTVRMVPFCAVIHAESLEWLNCYENFRWDRKRPFFAGRMLDRPYSFAAYSTTENVAPFQRLITQLFNAQLQNIAVSNVATVGVREASPAWRFFKTNGMKIRPGTVWPFAQPDDVNMQPLGKPVGSMAPEISFLNSEAEKMSVVTQYDRGAIPGRTPVGTVNAVDELAKMQPRLVLGSIRETLSEVIECFVRTLAQFYPEGVDVPFRDASTSDGVEVKRIGFPVEWRDGIFTFDITATGTEETAQALTMRDLMLSKEVSTFNGEMLSIVSSAFMPGTPPPIMLLASKIIGGRRNMLAEVFKHNKLNVDNYLPPLKQIESLPLELMQLQMMAQMAQGGDPNVLPAGGEDAVPAGPGGGEATGVVEGEPGDGGSPDGDPPEAVPTEPGLPAGIQ